MNVCQIRTSTMTLIPSSFSKLLLNLAVFCSNLLSTHCLTVSICSLMPRLIKPHPRELHTPSAVIRKLSSISKDSQKVVSVSDVLKVGETTGVEESAY